MEPRRLSPARAEQRWLRPAATPSRRLSVDAEHTGGLYERTYSGHYYAIYDDSGVRLSSRSLWDQPVPELAVISQRTHWVGDGMNGQEWLNLIRRPPSMTSR